MEVKTYLWSGCEYTSMGETNSNHVYCKDCGKKVKRGLAEDSDDWVHTDEGWLCPHCNPDSEIEW